MNNLSQQISHIQFSQKNYFNLTLNYLEQYDFFNLCTAEQKENIIQNIAIKHYYNNQIIYKKSEIANDIIIILKGAIKLIWVTSSGKNIIQNIIPFGNLLHITTAINHTGFIHDHVAHDATVIATVPKEILIDILKKNPEALFAIFELVCSRSYKLNERLYQHATETLRVKIIKQIIVFVENFSNTDYPNTPSTIKFSQESFADLLQTSRQSINKELAWLSSEGMIHIKYNQIFVLDYKKLKSLVE